jgi:hypothetical protein
VNEDHEEYVVPVDGAPKQPWSELPNSEKRTANAFTYSLRLAKMPRIAALATSVINS